MPTSLSIALSALGAFFSGDPRVRKLTLGYKYFAATRFQDCLIPRPREGSAPRLRLFTGFVFICVNLRSSASVEPTARPVLRLIRLDLCAFASLREIFSIRGYSWFQFAVRFA